MTANFVVTLATPQQVHSAFNGVNLKGNGQGRVLFVGRSNVGKSSLINVLCGTKLARVSSEPGKTRALHIYKWVEGRCIVVDLPGYGYARASKENREDWAGLIGEYLQADPKIVMICLLIDGRHEPSKLDQEAYEFLAQGPWAIVPILTKFDQLKNQSERSAQKKKVRQTLSGWGMQEAVEVWVSSKTGVGIVELKKRIDYELTATKNGEEG